MPVTSERPAPYASPSTMLDLLQRYRDRGLPSPINSEVLGRASVSDSLIPRTLQTLQTLDLITEEGQPTAYLEALRKASEGDYKQQMVAWLNDAYAEVLKYVDPAKDDEVAIRDAFRSYNPVGQQPRMVSLFIQLYAAAGVGTEKAPTIRQQRSVSIRPRPVSTVSVVRSAVGKAGPRDSGGKLPPALAGLISSLPAEGDGWSQARRDKFVTTFSTVLDFCFPILSERDAQQQNGDEV